MKNDSRHCEFYKRRLKTAITTENVDRELERQGALYVRVHGRCTDLKRNAENDHMTKRFSFTEKMNRNKIHASIADNIIDNQLKMQEQMVENRFDKKITRTSHEVNFTKNEECESK